MEAQMTHQGDGTIGFDWKAADDGDEKIEYRVCGFNTVGQGKMGNLDRAVL